MRTAPVAVFLACMTLAGCTGIVGDLDDTALPDARQSAAPDASDTHPTTPDAALSDTADAPEPADGRADTAVSDTADTAADTADTAAPDAPVDASELAGPSCGNGLLDPGESCDGSCPQSCPAPSGCQVWQLQGSAATCSASCVESSITACASGDGCCPSTCSLGDDADCDAHCGDGIVEGGERCDGNCPAQSACVSEGCTQRTWSGSAATCDARCVESSVTACASGDGCCPAGCSPTTDDDCQLDCRDAASWPAAWAAAEEAALVEINAQRAAGTDCPSGAKATAGPLTMDPALREAARCHSLDMVNQDFFAHAGSDGSNFSQRAAAAGYTGFARYENIAAGNSNPVAAVGQWMGSTMGHCDALMDGSVTEIGLGYAYGDDTRWGDYWTAVLGQ